MTVHAGQFYQIQITHLALMLSKKSLPYVEASIRVEGEEKARRASWSFGRFRDMLITAHVSTVDSDGINLEMTRWKAQAGGTAWPAQFDWMLIERIES